MKNSEDTFEKIKKEGKEILNNVKDDSKKFSKKEIEDGKGMALLSYIGFLVLIPYLGEKKNKYVRFHALEGMNLFIYELILGGLLTFVNIFIPLAFLRSLFSTIVSLICLALSIIGIINVCNDQAKELPVINQMKIIKK